MSKQAEEWRDIPGYNGYYQASDWGRVRSFYCGNGADSSARADRPHFLKRHFVNKGSQWTVILKRKGVRRVMTIGQAVASAFFGEIPPDTSVCHKNGDASDNCLWNLEIRSNLTQQRICAKRNLTGWNRTPVVKIDRNLSIVDAYPSVAEAARSNGFYKSRMWKFCAMQIQCSVFAEDGFIYAYDIDKSIWKAMQRAMAELDAIGERYDAPATERYYDLAPYEPASEETSEPDDSASWEDAPALIGGAADINL